MNRRSTLLLEHHLKELKLPTFLRRPLRKADFREGVVERGVSFCGW